MRRIGLIVLNLVTMAWLLTATAVMAQEQNADGIAPEEVPERAIENADDAVDRQSGEGGIVESCAALAMAESLAPVLRQLLDDARRSQAEANLDISSLEAALAQLEKGLENLPKRSDWEFSAVASRPPAAPAAPAAPPAQQRP